MSSKINEQERLFEITKFERRLWDDGVEYIAGMDEVGRGPLAGPVVVACVIMPRDPLIEGVKDSKKITNINRREAICQNILDTSISVGIGSVDNLEIDSTNILIATRKAFAQALDAMEITPQHVFVDHVHGLDLPIPSTMMVKGDAISYCIAAASIVAKVTRDRLMIKAGQEHPMYLFEKNKGYGTKDHTQAIKEHGLCPLHRRSFCKKFLLGNGASEIGRRGEQASKLYLEKKGYEILACNYKKMYYGEIDIIARTNDVLVFVEVKTRSTDVYGSPAEAVDIAKQKRIIDAALSYVCENFETEQQIRFDVVEVFPKGNRCKVNHIINAF